MHIAWLGKKTPFCGNVTYSREVTNGLLDRGHLVSFLHFAEMDAKPDRAFSDCAEVALPFLYKSQIYTIPALGSSKVLARSLAELRPHLVHASLTLSTLDFRLPEICRDLNLPLVATFHPAFDRKMRNLKSSTQYFAYQLYAPSLAQYDRVVVFSHCQRDLLVRLGVPAERVVIIPNGVDVQKYRPEPHSYLKAALKTNCLFVYMGRLSPEKNVESLLKGWKSCKLRDRAKLLIVGDGPLRGLLQSQYGPQDGVIWHGFEGDESRRIEILQAADVFVLPSLVEGLSLALLEAMACGLACIATDAGADGEVLEGGAGIVMDTQGVAHQLKTLLPLCCEHPELRLLLGQKARQRVLERYTLRHNLSRLELLYQGLMERSRLDYYHSSWVSSGSV
jgi:glycosyltransferase involved in cell wall biosynthesis